MAKRKYSQELYNTRIRPLLDAKPGSNSDKEKAMGLPAKIISNWNNAGYGSWCNYFAELSTFLGVCVEYLKGETDIKNPAPTNEDGTDKAILQFLHSLPIEKLVGILTLVDAPKELIAALNREEQKE